MRRRRTRGAGFVLFLALSLVLTVMPALAGDRQDAERLQAQKDLGRSVEEVTGGSGSSSTSASPATSTQRGRSAAEPTGSVVDFDRPLSQQTAEFTDGVYVVVFDGAPVVAYEGGIAGLPATAPGQAKKIDPESAKVVNYQKYLREKHEAALAAAGVATSKKFYDYTVSLDGMAVRLTGLQAAALAKQDGVMAVVPDERREVATISTPDFLGLTDDGGAWDSGYTGAGVVVGIVDSGVWPEHPSVAGSADDGPSRGRRGNTNANANSPIDLGWPDDWYGTCQAGEKWDSNDCSGKIVGARWYIDGLHQSGVNQLLPWEYKSARDYDGHGTHTATTAVGASGVTVEVDGLELGTASGMAPDAYLAVYKACWGSTGQPGAGCYTSDTTAAIDQAVADGVDVINYSISGTTTDFLDPVELSFLFAARAGVFVAASAGNSGPGAETVAHPSPWITTVAAGTHDRYYEGTVLLGDGTSFSGASFQKTGAGPASLVHGGDIAVAGADPAEAALCFPGTLDPALAAGTIVMCDRGVIARIDKSAEVARVGGIGMVHGNVTVSSVNADLHSVPTVHLQAGDADAVRAYIASAGASATAEITPGVFTPDAAAPEVASFSSRGPSSASTDLLKPDIMAPGVDIIAGVAPPGNGGRLFDAYSGTSMSGPHIAGLAAVVKSAHPDWGPMAIKSALMTSADDTGATPFDEGNGHVVPNSAIDPGLVYDAGWLDWLAFLCGSTSGVGASTCEFLEGEGYSFAASDLNLPTITVGSFAGSETVTRSVTNVGPAGQYSADVDAPPGVDVVVTPAVLSLGAGETATYDVTFVSTGATVYNEWAFGNLTWSDGSRSVRSTLTVLPVKASAPDEVEGAGIAGSLDFPITFGYSGDYTPAAHGLVAADTTEDVVVDDPGNDYDTATVGINSYLYGVAEGTAVLRFALFDEYTDGDDDLDLYLYSPNPDFDLSVTDPSDPAYYPFLQSVSGSPTSNEEITEIFPDTGNADFDAYVASFGLAGLTHILDVHGWQTDGPDAAFTLFAWEVPVAPPAGNMSVPDPGDAVLGTSGDVTVDWTGLDPDTIYMGAVSHSEVAGDPSDDLFALTLVTIRTD